MRLSFMAIFSLMTTASAIASTTVPFDPSGGLVVVEVIIDGSVKGRFGIDTGADFLYIDRKFARNHDLKFTQSTATRGVVGLQGGDTPSLVSVSSLQVGDESVDDIRALAIDMSAFVSDSAAILPDGLIGSDILSNFYVTIDYPNATLELSRSKPDFMRGQNYNRVPFHLYKSHIIVETRVNDHKGILMLFDYCASVSTISPQTAERMGLPIDEESVYRIDMLIDDELKTDNVVTVTRDMTPLKKAMPRAKFEGILGASFLRDHKVTIDYALKMIYVHK